MFRFAIHVLMACCAAGFALHAQSENLLKNPGFEIPLRDGSWYLNPALAAKGQAVQSVFGRHSGQRSLKLIPNSANTKADIGSTFGLSQALPAVYRGEPLYFGAWLAAEGASLAVLRVTAIASTGAVYFRELRQSINNRTSILFRDIIDIPDDPALMTIIVSCSAEGTSGAAYFDDVFVYRGMPTDWPAATGRPEPGPDIEGKVTVHASQALRRIPKAVYGTNVEWIWGGHGIVAPGQRDLDQSLVDFGKDAGFSSLRFPSGFFSDFYNWRNGIGPRESRPILFAFPAVAAGLSTNDFGTDEALEFADKLGAKLLITVNAVTGTPQEAADWVRYVNKDSQRVEQWEVGNELYVNLSAFDPALTAVPPESYARTYLDFARAMRAVDPSIKIGAIVDFNYGLTTYRPFPDWARTVLSRAGPEIDFVSVHNGFAPVIGADLPYPVRSVYRSMLGAPLAVKASLEDLGKEILRTTGADSKVGIIVSEWGPLFEANPSSKYIDHSKTLGSALYVAHVLKVLIEEPRVVGANAFKFLDRLPNGWIGVKDGKFTPKAPLYAMSMFTRHFGETVVATSSSSPGYDSRSIGWVDAAPFVPYLEGVSSVGDDGKVYVIMINKHFDRNVRALVQLQDFCPSGRGSVWTLKGTAVDANTGTDLPEGFALQATDEYGGRFHTGGPEEVQLVKSEFVVPGENFSYLLPPHSVVSLAIEGSPTACALPSPEF